MPGEVEEAGCVLGVEGRGDLQFLEFFWVVLFHLHQVVEIVAFSSNYHQWRTRYFCSGRRRLFRRDTLGLPGGRLSWRSIGISRMGRSAAGISRGRCLECAMLLARTQNILR